MPLYTNSTGEQEIGNDITGTSGAIVVASAPDVALPMETESAADSGISQEQSAIPGGLMQPKLLAVIAAAGAAGLLLGIILKKSLPALTGGSRLWRKMRIAPSVRYFRTPLGIFRRS